MSGDRKAVANKKFTLTEVEVVDLTEEVDIVGLSRGVASACFPTASASSASSSLVSAPTKSVSVSTSAVTEMQPENQSHTKSLPIPNAVTTLKRRRISDDRNDNKKLKPTNSVFNLNEVVDLTLTEDVENVGLSGGVASASSASSASSSLVSVPAQLVSREAVVDIVDPTRDVGGLTEDNNADSNTNIQDSEIYFTLGEDDTWALVRSVG